MDRSFLDLYEQELRFVREMAEEFAEAHPKVAGRLRLERDEVPDPSTERLLEGFAFLTARVRQRMDHQFPVFTEALLESLIPNLVRPQPSACVLHLVPDEREAALADGYTLPRGSALTARADGEGELCTYTTATDLALVPIACDEASYTEDSAAISPFGTGAALITIAVRCLGEATFTPHLLGALKFFVQAEPQNADRVLEAILARSVGVFAVVNDRPQRLERADGLGFTDAEALLPQGVDTFSGHRLLQEFFLMREKFHFFRVQQLQSIQELIGEKSVKLAFVLGKPVPALRQVIKAETFRLNTVPAINLFTRRSDRVPMSAAEAEHLIVPDRTKPRLYEVFDITRLEGVQRKSGERVVFSSHQESWQHRETGGKFRLRREARLGKGRSGAYTGSSVYVRLGMPHGGPPPSDMQQLVVSTLCTNRAMPLQLRRTSAFQLDGQAPIRSVSVVAGPTPPRAPLASGQLSWALIDSLSQNHLAFQEDGTAWLNAMLSAYGWPTGSGAGPISSLRAKTISRRLPGPGPVSFGYGLQFHLIADEDQLSGSGPFVLSSVIRRFLERSVTLNTVVETSAGTKSEPLIMTWDASSGRRPAL